MNINARKRAAHGRRVREALQAILNDPAVMPNADCADLVVSVGVLEFGSTPAEMFIEVHAWRRLRTDPSAESPHDKYMREARAAGRKTYTDLDEVFFFPAVTAVVSSELQKRLGLTYAPVIRRLCKVSAPGDGRRSRRRRPGPGFA